jgi:hypothetical protein
MSCIVEAQSINNQLESECCSRSIINMLLLRLLIFNLPINKNYNLSISTCTPFAVVPLSYCEHLELIKEIKLDSSLFEVNKACLKCSDAGIEVKENWICLTCGEIYCSRYVKNHMVSHYEKKKHPMVLSFSDISVWCYECDAYVHNELLSEAKMFAYNSKFGSI